jgi:hypothetical protein
MQLSELQLGGGGAVVEVESDHLRTSRRLSTTRRPLEVHELGLPFGALRQGAAKSLIKSQSGTKKPGAKTKRTTGESKRKGGDTMFRRVPGSMRR